MKRSSHSRLRPLVSAVVIASAAAATAGTTAASSPAPVQAPPVSPWDVTAAAGLALSNGNTDTLGASAQILATYLEGGNEAILGADYFYGENNSVTTVNNFRAFAAYNRTLAGSFYAGVQSDFYYDEIAHVDYRISALPMLGFYLVKTDSTVLALEAGAGYVWEDQGGIASDYWSYRVGQRFSHVTGGNVKLSQSVSWTSSFDDSENWLLLAQAGFAVPVSAHWAIGATARYAYDNTPAAGQQEDDLGVFATLSYSLQGFAPEAAAGRQSLKAEKKAAALPPMGWANSAGLAFGLTSGNSDTLSVIGDLAMDYRTDHNEWLNYAGVGYGETDSTTTLENVRASSQYNFLFTDTVYAGVGSGFRYDDIAAIDYQFTPAAVAGIYLVKNDRARLSVEAGPGYVFEKVGGIESDYFAVQAAQKLALAVADGVTLTEAVVYNAEANDFNNYTLTAGVALDVDMGANLSLRTALTNTYDNTPATGLEKNDLLLSAGLALRF